MPSAWEGDRGTPPARSAIEKNLSPGGGVGGECPRRTKRHPRLARQRINQPPTSSDANSIRIAPNRTGPETRSPSGTRTPSSKTPHTVSRPVRDTKARSPPPARTTVEMPSACEGVRGAACPSAGVSGASAPDERSVTRTLLAAIQPAAHLARCKLESEPKTRTQSEPNRANSRPPRARFVAASPRAAAARSPPSEAPASPHE